jgi:DNA-binding transcriptional LysR family regulator
MQPHWPASATSPTTKWRRADSWNSPSTGATVLIIDRLFYEAGVERAVTLEVVDVASALEMVRARLGLAFVPEEALAERHDLVCVDLHQPPPRSVSGLQASMTGPCQRRPARCGRPFFSD